MEKRWPRRTARTSVRGSVVRSRTAESPESGATAKASLDPHPNAEHHPVHLARVLCGELVQPAGLIAKTPGQRILRNDATTHFIRDQNHFGPRRGRRLHEFTTVLGDGASLRQHQVAEP